MPTEAEVEAAYLAIVESRAGATTIRRVARAALEAAERVRAAALVAEMMKGAEPYPMVKDNDGHEHPFWGHMP